MAFVLTIAWNRAAMANQEPPRWAQVLFYPTFIGGLLLVQARLAWNSGWSALATRYRTHVRPNGRRFWRQVTRFGTVPEGGMTILTVSDSGLFLRPFPLFFFRRPPLLIPWREIGWVRERKTFPWGRDYELDLGGITTVQVRGKAFAAMQSLIPQLSAGSPPNAGRPQPPVGMPPPPIE